METTVAANTAVEPIRIHTFGEFSLSYNGKRIDDHSSRSKKMWTLLQYLIAFRSRELQQSDLIDLLWADDEIDNPAGTLKTLLHRLRALLDELGYEGGGKEMIVFRRGAYSWNKQVPVVIDSELFDSLTDRAAAAEPAEKLELLLSAIELYRGDYLPKAEGELWAIPLTSFYRSKYSASVREAVELLSSTARESDIAHICKRAVEIDPYDEQLHIHLMRAYVATGEYQQAMSHYEYVTKLFFNQFGVSPSTELLALYKEVIKTSKTMELDLGIIKDDLREREQVRGGFFCEYEVFKDIYRIEARSAARSGQIVHIALITVSDMHGEQVAAKQRNVTMERVGEVISSSLRRGDVYSRYSISQYLLMLPGASFENSEKVLDRIARAFRRKYPKMNILLRYKVLPLDPLP